MTLSRGPWEVEFDQAEGEEPWPAWLEANGVHLATFEDATPADARLIAAAPELLEVCEAVVRALGPTTDYFSLYLKAETAIAKAREVSQ